MSVIPTDGDACKRVLTLTNRQRDCRINAVHLRRLVRFHLEEQLQLGRYDLAIHSLSAGRMAAANEAHLGHKGPTDVITFNYGDPGQEVLHGELLVCPAVAVEQARDYGTTWESELMRYIIHGVLHLRGYDDQSAAARRVMKRQEDRLLEALTAAQPIQRLGAHPRTSRKQPLE
jgi:probable rRNA maturation factor